MAKTNFGPMRRQRVPFASLKITQTIRKVCGNTYVLDILCEVHGIVSEVPGQPETLILLSAEKFQQEGG